MGGDPFDYGDLTSLEGGARRAVVHDGITFHEARSNVPRPHCSRCALDLLMCGAQWWICRCGAPCCLSCQGQPCSRCQRGPVWGEHPTERTGAATDDVNNDCVADPSGERDMMAPLESGAAVGTLVSMTPRALQARRMEAKRAANERRLHDRAVKRTRRREHETNGRRPLRLRRSRRQHTLEIVSINPSAGTTLVDELEYGTALGKPHLILVQELAVGPTRCASLERDFLRLGWTPILGKTYVKNSGHGGGTGILSRGEPGVRPLASLGGCLEGRASAGVAECSQEVTVGSLYGISGMAAHRQISLWSAMATTLARAGRPFILAADWQVHPRELAALRLDRHLDATIVAPSVATNHVSGNIIDYFLVSNSLLAASDDGKTAGWTWRPSAAAVSLLIDQCGCVLPFAARSNGSED